jgi:predicted dehydrogenase
MALAGQAGVKGIIVEKPIALDYPQAKRIQDVAEEHSLKVAVNMQRRYFHTCG